MKSFSERCYELLRKVPAGKITTYKEIAKALKTQAYQAVGSAMRNNPYAPEVPCHRVVASDGSIGGFGGQTTGKKIKEKILLLKKEGINFKENKITKISKKISGMPKNSKDFFSIKIFDKTLHRF